MKSFQPMKFECISKVCNRANFRPEADRLLTYT